MRIQTFSIVAGSAACNARCPFCISKMTVENGVELKEPSVNWRNFHKACQLAKMAGCTTAMITGKGEPTLFPNQVTKYLFEARKYDFPIMEIQTNGIPAATKWDRYERYLAEWYNLGLSTVAISIVHYSPERNREIYLPYAKEYIDLPDLISKLHEMGLSVRLACVMLKNYIQTPQDIRDLIQFARKNKVEQLTLRPVNKPDASVSQDLVAYKWTANHALSDEDRREMVRFFDKEATVLMSLMHGALVYDVGGQNVCWTECLTMEPDTENVRSLIFFPDGHLRYDWQYEGAIIL